MTDRSTPPLRAVRIEARCPVCSRPADTKYMPFCTKRCADIDLGRWLKEGYRIETDEGPGDGSGEDDPRGDGASGQRG